MTRLVHTGNVIVDVALTVDELPERGSDVLASSSSIQVGGAFNTLAAAARDGLEAVHVGARGTGPFASLVADALSREGIRATGPVEDVDTGYSVVLIDRDAERTFVTHTGAEALLTAQDLDRTVLVPGDTVAVSGYSLAHSPGVVGPWAAGLPAGIVVVFDPSPLVGTLDPDDLDGVLQRADIVTANTREARILGPRLDAVRRLVVRAGADGCWLRARGETSARRIAGFPVRALDTTGAGDTHCGVLCAALARGESLESAARRANAAASIAVGRQGPATAPVSAEIDALLASAAGPA